MHGYLVLIQTFECVNTCFGLSVHHCWNTSNSCCKQLETWCVHCLCQLRPKLGADTVGEPPHAPRTAAIA
eukprot:7011501-Prymnesium_polylepis.1